METPNQRPIHEVAQEIKRLWKPKIYFGAVPYLEAMESLNTIEDNYGMDDAHSIIIYFLANAQTFRGEDAKRLKTELKTIAGIGK